MNSIQHKFNPKADYVKVCFLVTSKDKIKLLYYHNHADGERCIEKIKSCYSLAIKLINNALNNNSDGIRKLIKRAINGHLVALNFCHIPPESVICQRRIGNGLTSEQLENYNRNNKFIRLSVSCYADKIVTQFTHNHAKEDEAKARNCEELGIEFFAKEYLKAELVDSSIAKHLIGVTPATHTESRNNQESALNETQDTQEYGYAQPTPQISTASYSGYIQSHAHSPYATHSFESLYEQPAPNINPSYIHALPSTPSDNRYVHAVENSYEQPAPYPAHMRARTVFHHTLPSVLPSQGHRGVYPYESHYARPVENMNQASFSTSGLQTRRTLSDVLPNYKPFDYEFPSLVDETSLKGTEEWKAKNWSAVQEFVGKYSEKLKELGEPEFPHSHGIAASVSAKPKAAQVQPAYLPHFSPTTSVVPSYSKRKRTCESTQNEKESKSEQEHLKKARSDANVVHPHITPKPKHM